MRVPNEFMGRWTGLINDTERKRPYDGEIVISMDSVRATYSFERVPKSGELVLQYEADGFLALKDDIVSGWSGSLVLYLDNHGNLKCVWRSGAKFSEATMTRVEKIESS